MSGQDAGRLKSVADEAEWGQQTDCYVLENSGPDREDHRRCRGVIVSCNAEEDSYIGGSW